ncbi:hypothetical protein IQ219_16525 [Synechocystis sp. LEGE 06083]|nr:hypothetical protein [Synechocystis sp. LEGE 06083]MBE9196872.1 hypothetical protein [Synechocystis sp. LEGE 06083]
MQTIKKIMPKVDAWDGIAVNEKKYPQLFGNRALGFSGLREIPDGS